MSFASLTSSPLVDRHWMARALELARRGQGAVEPNPMVGAVLVDATGNLVAEGWHHRFGGAHAEVEALDQVSVTPPGSTLYVTLEPCCHHGKTPPCTNRILAAGVARVVAAMPDPFPQAAGGGLTQLRAAGLQVEVGLMQAEAEALNAPYLMLVRELRPWVIAKWAMTMDGNIATRTGDSQWITSPPARARVQELRSRVDAILVGRGTAQADDPQLTARLPGAAAPLRTALRVVVTATGDLTATGHLARTACEVPVRIYTRHGQSNRLDGWRTAGADVVELPSDEETGQIAWATVLTHLGQERRTNILVEGGSRVLSGLSNEDLLDEAWVFVAPKLVGGHGLSPLAGPGVARLAQAPLWTTLTATYEPPDALLIARRVRQTRELRISPTGD